MIYLIDNEKYGIHHVVNSGIACGLDVSTEIVHILGKNIDLILSQII
jgi:nucleoside phosphorylase